MSLLDGVYPDQTCFVSLCFKASVRVIGSGKEISNIAVPLIFTHSRRYFVQLYTKKDIVWQCFHFCNSSSLPFFPWIFYCTTVSIVQHDEYNILFSLAELSSSRLALSTGFSSMLSSARLAPSIGFS